MAVVVRNSLRPGDSTAQPPLACRPASPSPHLVQAAGHVLTGTPAFVASAGPARGYQSREYALSLAEFGAPRWLPRSGGWLIEREIPGSGRDAMGCYPLFACADWTGLSADLEVLQDRLVSVALVTDPFGDFDRLNLEGAFDFVRPFKDHFVVDLEQDPEVLLSRNHRYKARRSLRDARVEVCEDPPSHLDEWMSFYDTLILRHSLRGITAFSRTSFARQLQVPGLVMFRYVAAGVPIGAQMWFIHRETAYNHLLATNAAGYSTWAAYGLCYEAIRHFRSGLAGPVGRVDLGGGAGIATDPGDGLTRFKRGWATGTRPVLFCGRIFDPERYAALVTKRGAAPTNYFPAYRQGEFRS